MILVTNDDGYSEGLKILFETAKKLDNAYALIPDRQKSAVSKSLTLHKALRIHKLHEDIYTLNGNPADAVLFSIYSKQFSKPDLVLSGINFGDNTGLGAMLSSGTLAACWEAALEGIPSIAFSLYREDREWREKTKWGNVEIIKKYVLDIIQLLKKKFTDDCFFSVTLPGELNDNTKILFTKKTQRQRFKTIITKRNDPYNIPYYWLSGDFSNIEKDTDLYEVAVNKNISITRITLDFLK